MPSATESLFALGLGNQVVAVTHECDYPPEAARLPVVTRPVFDFQAARSGEIERQVSLAAERGDSLYEVDTAAIRELEPDLVIAQDVCRVCAVAASQVVNELAPIPVLRQHPHTLDDVLADIVEVAGACGVDAAPLIAELRARLEVAHSAAVTRPRVRGVFLEWLDPPYPAGHWTPDLLELAGIDDPLARPGRPSVASTWEQVRAARPELLVLAPCGWDAERARREAAASQDEIDSVGAARVVVLDGSAYFNRPGPRLVDSLEVLVAAL
ncbi:MAG TPA: cobalamin-binding protein [Candidatus Dormibacteraeota bacterium]|nr:cobalamin-binding protein [Candidatus Dormibacteraeota bacterium]